MPLELDRTGWVYMVLVLALMGWWFAGESGRAVTGPPLAVARPPARPAVRPARVRTARPPPRSVRPSPSRDPHAPVKVSAADRARRKPSKRGAPYLGPLRELLVRRFDRAVGQLEACRAATYLGFLGVKSRLPMVLAQVDDPASDAGEKLPALAALIEGFGDKRRLGLVRGIADDPASGEFARNWALELLGHAGDQSRATSARAGFDDARRQPSERVRSASILADMGDATRARAALELGRSASLSPAERARALAAAVRMSRRTPRGAAAPLAELRRTLRTPALTRGEKLTIARQLCALGDGSASAFLLRTIEEEASSVLEQLRALDALALLGRPVHLGLLAEVAARRHPASDAAHRVLVLMGDRSGIAGLLESARRGDLDALRTLVIAALLDRQHVSPGALAREPRYRRLLVES